MKNFRTDFDKLGVTSGQIPAAEFAEQARAGCLRDAWARRPRHVYGWLRRLSALLVLTAGLLMAQAQSRPSTQPATSPARTSRPTTLVAVDQSTPLALVQTMHAALVAGDLETFSNCWIPDQRQKVLENYRLNSRWIAAQRPLILLMREKFGKEAVTALASGGNFCGDNTDIAGMSPCNLLIENGKIDWSEAKIEIQGDAAEIPGDLVARKLDGKWWAAMEDMEADDWDESAKEIQINILLYSPVYAEMIKGIKAGTITKDNFDAKGKEISQKIHADVIATLENEQKDGTVTDENFQNRLLELLGGTTTKPTTKPASQPTTKPAMKSADGK